MVKTLIVLILCAFHFVSPCQTTNTTLIGVIVDNDELAPIPSVVCFLKNNEFIGDVTNSQGEFSIDLHQLVLADTLEVSSLGYKKALIPLSEWGNSNTDTILIKLHRQEIMLDDVLVEAESPYRWRQLVMRALANTSKNYPNKAHQLTGLYRKISTRENKYTHLAEAVVTVEDWSYKAHNIPKKIKLEGYRESFEYVEIDTLVTSTIEKMETRFARVNDQSPYNPLYKLYQNNYLGYYNKQGTCFNYKEIKANIDQYRFTLIDMSVSGTDTVYQIAWGWSPKAENNKPLSGRTYVKINAMDLAITEFQFTTGLPGEIFTQNTVKFRKKSGVYYPIFIREISPRFINKNNKNGEYNIMTYWFDKIKNKDFKKLKPKEVLPRSGQYKNLTYDSFFWNHNEFTQNHPLPQAVRESLEFERSLESQFNSQ